jgi:hypothetical protein
MWISIGNIVIIRRLFTISWMWISIETILQLQVTIYTLINIENNYYKLLLKKINLRADD